MVPLPGSVVFISGALAGMMVLLGLYLSAREEEDRTRWAFVILAYTLFVLVLLAVVGYDGL